MKRLSTFLYSVLVCSCLIFAFSGCKVLRSMKDVPNKNITIEQLEEMFANIKAKADWDMDGSMLWGYFFTHHEPSLLEKTKKVLIKKGYTFVDIHLSDKDESDEPNLWWLHVEKIEIHSPESLDKRNNEFYIFAHEFGIDSYDGMDVGSIQNR